MKIGARIRSFLPATAPELAVRMRMPVRRVREHLARLKERRLVDNATKQNQFDLRRGPKTAVWRSISP